MSFGTNPTTISQGTLSANQLPVSSVAVPNTSNGDLTALEGGPISTDGSGNKTAPASTYIKDGNDVTKGSQSDAAWGGSGSASEIAILKKIVAELAATLTVSGTVTSNAGTGSFNNGSVGTDGSALPTLSTLIGASDGTNLQQLLVESATNRNLRIGLYSGANEATITGANALKVDNSAITQPVSGTVATTQSGTWTMQPGNTANSTPWLQNVNQWNGAAPSVSNPVITQDQIRWWINNGQGFSATTNKLTAGGSITGGMSVFNPNASGKTLIIYSIKFMIGNTSYNQINFTTSDPALGTTVTPVNTKAANSTTTVTVCSLTNTTVTPAGTLVDMTAAASNVQAQALTSGGVFIVPANNGICFYSNLSGINAWFVSMAWLEI